LPSRSNPRSPSRSTPRSTIVRGLPSFRDFVDDALFHPRWGYYSTGAVRFGDGGHYDTFPTALSPLVGRMVAGAARRVWLRMGRPRRFEICELGAGNGQLCLDTVATIAARAATSRAWRAFADAVHHRVIERSPALVARQRATLGPLAARVTWTRADLSRRRAPLRLGRHGFVIANEVLDCLAHHKIVPGAEGTARVAFVVPTRRGRTLDRRALGRALADGANDVRYHESALPLDRVPGLRAFLGRHCPERLHASRPFPPYFACPEIPRLVRATARLYDVAEIVWIDYGAHRPFHLRAPERRRVFAGPPHSNRSVYDAPGRDDITFMVDFTVVATAARDAGLAITHDGGQGALATVGGVRLGADEIELVARTRALGWMLDVMGVGPERAWRQGGLTWSRRDARGGALRAGIARDVEEFLGRRRTRFRMMALSSGPSAFRGAGRRGPRTDC
jgi:SAM-dependent MidA family methyltransferase